MTRIKKISLAAAVALTASLSGVAFAHNIPSPPEPATVQIEGEPVENIRQNANTLGADYCEESDLPPGEGLADKGNTCVSTVIGEIAAHPVRVTATTPFIQKVGKPVEVKVLVADNQGVLDLNAFTADATGKAGVTLFEHPGELDEDGRPLMHCHIGLVSVESIGALPGENYNAAFSGVQGVEGDLTVTITGLAKGSYRGDVFCSQPGHPILPTNVATRVQAFDTFDLKVVGYGKGGYGNGGYHRR